MKEPKYYPLAMSSQRFANDYGKRMARYWKRQQNKQIDKNRIIKNSAIAIIFALLTSCGSYDEKYSCSKGTITVLNKDKSACARGGGWCGFKMYLYNGTKADWYSTNEATYNAYNINDTLPTIVLTIVKKEK
jgi:hypothetical protein